MRHDAAVGGDWLLMSSRDTSASPASAREVAPDHHESSAHAVHMATAAVAKTDCTVSGTFLGSLHTRSEKLLTEKLINRSFNCHIQWRDTTEIQK